MSRGVNKWIGIGNLTADPQTRYSANGAAVTNFSIACNDSYRDRNTGERQETVEYVRIVTFNKLAEICGEYLRKGFKVYIEGRLQTRRWQGQDGQDRYTTEIIANDMQMLSTPQSDGGVGGGQPAQSQGGGSGGGFQGDFGGNPADDFDDDIPF